MIKLIQSSAHKANNKQDLIFQINSSQFSIILNNFNNLIILN